MDFKGDLPRSLGLRFYSKIHPNSMQHQCTTNKNHIESAWASATMFFFIKMSSITGVHVATLQLLRPLCQHHVAHIKCNFIILHMLFINFIGHHTQVNKGLPYSSYAALGIYNEQDHCDIAVLCNVRASHSIFFAYMRDAVAMRGHVVDAGHR